MANSTDQNVRVNFQTFFNGWITRQEKFSDQLLNAITQENIHKNEQHQSLIEQVLSHYQQYFEEKLLAASQDVFLFFSPPWFTSFERTFLWVGGFRPSLVFKLVKNSVHDLTEEQERGLEQVKAETRREERELAETMARIQESVAAPPLMNLARRAGSLIDGEVTELETAMQELQTGMLAALGAADARRGTAVTKVLQILHPIQSVKLMAAAAQFHLRVRMWGLQQDEQIITANGL